MSLKSIPNTTKIIKFIGKGTFGSVYLVEDERFTNQLAMKSIEIIDKIDEIRVKKEIKIHKKLNHPHIIKFLYSEKILQSYFLFIEYAENNTLKFHLKSNRLGFPQSKALKYFKNLMDGLNYLHKYGIVHRDIRPSNLMLDDNDCLKIIDFGSSIKYKFYEEKVLLQSCWGNMHYRAPETFYFIGCINNNKILEDACLHVQPHHAEPLDIWSSGIVLVEMLTGLKPWRSVNSNEFSLFKKFNDGETLDLNEFQSFFNINLEIFVLLIEPMLAILPHNRATITSILDNLTLLLDTIE